MSESGTNRAGPMTSVDRGRPEVSQRLKTALPTHNGHSQSVDYLSQPCGSWSLQTPCLVLVWTFRDTTPSCRLIFR